MAKTKGTSKEVLPATTGEEREKVLKATEDEIDQEVRQGLHHEVRRRWTQHGGRGHPHGLARP